MSNRDETPEGRAHGGPHVRLILLVDDDARTARLMAQMLREDGFDVEVATNGASAIARLTRPPTPDILVTDLRMPHVDGEAVTRFGRSQRPGLPVFIVTGYPGLVARSGLGEPPPILFTKPVDYVLLRDEIVRVLAAVGGTPPSSSSPPSAG